jgi:hypothetical protein
MKKNLLIIFLLVIHFYSYSQLPAGSQWGCASIPSSGIFDTICYQKVGEIKLGQGYFVTNYGTSDSVFLVIPQNRPTYAIGMAVAWNYYRNVAGNNQMSINHWFAVNGKENGFTCSYGETLPLTIYDTPSASTVTLPTKYTRGRTLAMNTTHVNNSYLAGDGCYQFTSTGYITAAPYFPIRMPAPVEPNHTNFSIPFETACFMKTYYDLSILRRAQFINGINVPALEAASSDPYGMEAMHAFQYNVGPNSGCSAVGATMPAANYSGAGAYSSWWAGSPLFSGGVSSYAQKVVEMTAVLDNNMAYAAFSKTQCGGCYFPGNDHFYCFYDGSITWANVDAYLTTLTVLYPEVTPAFKTAIKAVFDGINGGAAISFRYQMGAVIDAITLNLPKEDPGFNAAYTINGTGCKLGCRAPYTIIEPQGPTTICAGQFVLLKADVDGATSSTTYQWQKNNVNIAGATAQTYSATATGTYSIIVCWQSINEISKAMVSCCAQPECNITVTVNGACSSCVMGLTLTQTQNSCTTMPNGSIKADIITAALGPYEYIWSGPTSGNFISALQTYTIPGLRDGKYTVTVRRVADHTCLAVQDIFVTPVTLIKESLTATVAPASCASQLNAILVNQQPNTCLIDVNYGSLKVNSWDASFSMDLKANGVSLLTMYEGNTTAARSAPWDWWPNDWVTGLPAPNTTTITVNDGDVLSLYGIISIPMGVAVPNYMDGGIRLSGATFTNLTTSVVNTTPVKLRYQGPNCPTTCTAPTSGSRKIEDSYKVTCPVVSPPAYTYSWSPSAGLTNPNIKNPLASVNVATTYTVTATHPSNTSCQLTATVLVPANCAILPVNMLSFDAQLENNHVSVTWATASEINCRNFVVEKSKDGFNFISTATLACHNSSGNSAYSFIDEYPYTGTSYYRVKQTDLNGKLFYTDIREIKISELQARIYPNPFSANLNIELGGKPEELVEVRVTDIQGRIIYSQKLAGDAKVMLGAEYSAGVYFIQLIDKWQVKNYKIVKQ